MSELSVKSRKTRVEEMVQAATAENWEVFLGYFSRDLYYKLGVAEPLHGPEACRDALAAIYKKLKPAVHEVRGIWEIQNVVLVEMIAHYVSVAEGRPVSVPCCDVYRFEGDLIKEWRVYPDASQAQL
jgi:ketosteroid isomerase-like protein